MTGQPVTPPAHFVVVVPGYMGSRLRDRSTGELVWLDLKALLRDPFHLGETINRLFETLTYPNDKIEPAGIMDQIVFAPPLFKQEHYGRLLAALEEMGYTIDPLDPHPNSPAAYTFAYDWRQDNRISARQLGRAIEGWRKQHAGAKAWIVAHSNGGLVSRWYIEKEGGKEHVDRLFLMGSPWDGAPKAMSILLNGLEIAFLRSFSRYNIAEISRNAVRTFPSFYQLIPYKDPFLNDVNNEKVDLFADLRWIENDRHAQLVLDGRKFNQDLGATLSVETLCFFGARKPTTTFGRVNRAAGGRWAGIDWSITESGDGTVPERSAVHPLAAQKLPFTASHGDIYVNPAVLEKLDWEMARKYRLGVLAEAEVGSYHIQFEPEGDAFMPGEEIRVWATIHEQQDGRQVPVFNVPIWVELKLQAALPTESPADSADSIEGPRVELVDAASEPGRYEGSLTAPGQGGYYELEAAVSLPGQERPLVMQELVLVEPELRAFMAHAAPPDELAAGDEGFESSISKGIVMPSGAEPGARDAGKRDANKREAGERDVTKREAGFHEASRSAGDFHAEHPAEEAAWNASLELGGLSGAEGEMVFSQPPGGEEPQAEPSPPAADKPAGARWLNARIADHPEDEPLRLGQEYCLALFVDVVKAASGTVFADSRLFSTGEEQVKLTVHLTSQDFIVHTVEPQTLRVPKTGRSKNKARFDVEPLHAGEGKLTALFYKENNFVQGMILTLNTTAQAEVDLRAGVAVETPAPVPASVPAPVPASVPAISAVEVLGRPIDGAFVIQPRDLSLIIKKDGDAYVFTLVGATVSEARLPLTADLLDALVADTRSKMQEVVYLWEDDQGTVNALPPGSKVPPSITLPYQAGLTISENVAAEGLRRMAAAGWMLYDQLFYGPAAGPDAHAMGNRLRALLTGNALFKVQIVSQEFLLPWGVLYLQEFYDPNSVTPESFLGFRHIVEHIPLQQGGYVSDTVISSRPALELSINYNEGIDRQFGVKAVAGQLEYFRGLAAQHVTISERKTAQDFLQAVGDRANGDKILYFYGHAVSKDLSEGGPAGSALEFGPGSKVTLNDLKLRAPTRVRLNGSPLVFINACESAELSPRFYDGFMPYFTARGARGLIGSECQVPARFGDEFARRFFKDFLRGDRSLGQIFMQLRRGFYAEHRNILGLLYALYCDGDTRVIPGID